MDVLFLRRQRVLNFTTTIGQSNSWRSTSMLCLKLYSQYVSIRYTERLAEAGIEPSVGSNCDSYDNALYKAELILCRSPWKTREAMPA